MGEVAGCRPRRTGVRAAGERSPPPLPGRRGRRPRAPAPRRPARRSAMPATSIGRGRWPAATARRHRVVHFRMPPSLRAGSPVLGHHHLDRPREHDVRGSPVGLDQALPRAARAARRRRCRGSRAAGSAAATGAANAEDGVLLGRRRHAGQQVDEHADGEPDQLLLGEPCGVDGRAAEAAATLGPGQGYVDEPAPRRGGGQHPVGQSLDRTPGRLVEPADQLEVDGVGEGARELRTSRSPGRGRATPTRSSYPRSGGGQPNRPRPRRTT